MYYHGRRKLPKAGWTSSTMGGQSALSGWIRINWSAKTWMGNCLPCPSISYAPAWFLPDNFSIIVTSSWHFKSWKGENNGKFWSRKLFHMTQNPHFRTGTRIQSIGKQRRSLPCREQTKGIHVQKLESPRQKSLFSDELLSTDKSGPAFRRFAWSKTARTGPLNSSRNWILCTCSSHVFTNPEFSTYL